MIRICRVVAVAGAISTLAQAQAPPPTWWDLSVAANFTGFNGPPVGGADAAPDTPSVFTSLQEQLGLKLEPRRGPVETLVLDSVERPTSD